MTVSIYLYSLHLYMTIFLLLFINLFCSLVRVRLPGDEDILRSSPFWPVYGHSIPCYSHKWSNFVVPPTSFVVYLSSSFLSLVSLFLFHSLSFSFLFHLCLLPDIKFRLSYMYMKQAYGLYNIMLQTIGADHKLITMVTRVTDNTTDILLLLVLQNWLRI